MKRRNNIDPSAFLAAHPVAKGRPSRPAPCVITECRGFHKGAHEKPRSSRFAATECHGLPKKNTPTLFRYLE